MRKLIIILVSLALIIGLVYYFREPLLRSGATLLIHEDELQRADALFVLSGGGYDRGNEAVTIYQRGFAHRIICTGGNPVIELKVFNIDTMESDMTVANLRRQFIAESAITLIREGTSTQEE